MATQVGMSIPVEFFPPFVQAAVEAIQVWDVAKDVRIGCFAWHGFHMISTRLDVGLLNEGFNNYFFVNSMT